MDHRALRGEFRIGAWSVQPEANRLQRNGEIHQLEPRAMDVLVFLAENAGKTVSKEQIFSAVWADTFVTDSALWKCVSQLRRILEAGPGEPKLIVTVARKGYRLETTVEVPAEPRPQPVPSTRRWTFAAGFAVAFALMAVLAAWFSGIDTATPSPAHGSRPTVLMARIDNRTGDPLLDGTLEVVLEGRLNDSGRVRLVSRPRVENILTLMRRPLDSTLTEALAREVSLRDGRVDFVLAGQIDGLGSRYHVTLRLLDGLSHDLLASKDLGCETREGLLALADTQAAWLLGRLGIDGLRPRDQPPRVTTKSLEALSLYVRGMAAYAGGGTSENVRRNSEATQLFEEAARVDPEFASAHLMVAWSRYMTDQAQGVAESDVVYRPPFLTGSAIVSRRVWNAIEQAMATRDHASLVERAFIEGCYHEWQGEPRKAAPFYRLAADLQPEHRFAANNLKLLGVTLGDGALYSEGSLALSRGRPVDWQGGLLRQVSQTGDLEAALEIRDRIAALTETESGRLSQARPDASAEREHEAIATAAAFDIWRQWVDRRYPEALSLLESLDERVSKLHAGGVEVRKYGYPQYLAALQIVLGKLADARATRERYDLRSWREGVAAWGSSPALLLSMLEEQPKPTGDEDGMWLAKMFFDGDFAAGQKIDESFDPLSTSLTLALQLSRPDERIDALKDWVSRCSWYERQNIVYHCVRWKLARELAVWGRQDEAVGVLKDIVAERNRTWVGGVVIWQKAALDLAGIYRLAGRADAEPLMAELAEMLQFADPTHPILSELERLRRSAQRQAPRAETR